MVGGPITHVQTPLYRWERPISGPDGGPFLYRIYIYHSTHAAHNMYYTVGWVDFRLFFTFLTKVPLRFVIYLPKGPKIAKKNFFDPVTLKKVIPG
jgi:hypothetical protein